MTPGTTAGDPAPGARAVLTRAQRLLLLLGFALLVVFRLPHAWVEGRFLDEEATVFLAHAWHRPWLDALFRSFAGYLNLAANAATLLAVALERRDILPLERAPYLTMTLALAVQLLPAILLLTGWASWLARRAAVIAALLIVVVTPATEEVFLNVLHIQFHLALCAALILALDTPERRAARIGYAILLFAAPLCGPGAIVVAPLFAARALVDRDRERLKQFGALAAGAAVQLLFFYGASPMRGHLLDPGTIAAIMSVRLIALPLLNSGSANRIGAAIHASQMAGGVGWWGAAAVAVALFGLLIWVATRRRDAAIWLVLSALAIATVSFGVGIIFLDRSDLFKVNAGERYNFLPVVLLGLALVVLAMRRTRGWRAYAAPVLLLLLSGAIRYPVPSPEFDRGPSWPAEVASWRRDPRHPLAVWPRPWVTDLSDDPRPCPPVGPDPARSTAPRWCESGWVAGFYRQQGERQ